jgi:hypothetical protein
MERRKARKFRRQLFKEFFLSNLLTDVCVLEKKLAMGRVMELEVG